MSFKPLLPGLFRIALFFQFMMIKMYILGRQESWSEGRKSLISVCLNVEVQWSTGWFRLEVRFVLEFCQQISSPLLTFTIRREIADLILHPPVPLRASSTRPSEFTPAHFHIITVQPLVIYRRVLWWITDKLSAALVNKSVMTVSLPPHLQIQRENLSLHHPDRPPRRPDPRLLP